MSYLLHLPVWQPCSSVINFHNSVRVRLALYYGRLWCPAPTYLVTSAMLCGVSTCDELEPPGDILMTETHSALPLTAEKINALTKTAPVLSSLLVALQSDKDGDWARPELAPYRNRKQELSTHKGCVLCGCRVIIPEEARTSALPLLHANRMGMTAMRRCACSHM